MSEATSINGNLQVRAMVDTNQLQWTASPSGTVWRKRVHLVGPAEAGQVTSVVRYEANSKFPSHDHPEGEEIFVLSGVFSDEHGDWPAGTYLLNPEGFRHAPFSRPGCVLFVKLRQFPGLDRQHVATDTTALAWASTSTPGVEQKRLYAQPDFADTMRLERWAPGTRAGERRAKAGLEYYVLEGELTDAEGTYPAGTWLRLPPGSVHEPHSQPGCTVYIKAGGHAYLRDARELAGS